MVNQHQTTIWENTFYVFQTSNMQIQAYTEAKQVPKQMCFFLFPSIWSQVGPTTRGIFPNDSTTSWNRSTDALAERIRRWFLLLKVFFCSMRYRKWYGRVIFLFAIANLQFLATSVFLKMLHHEQTTMKSPFLVGTLKTVPSIAG